MAKTAPLDWPLAPIAHRGLHDLSRGIVENSPTAVVAARDHGFGIEVDLQLSRDGAALVFHDFTLDRLTGETGPVRERAASELAAVAYSDGQDRVMRFDALLDLVGGAVPLYVELKSDHGRNATLVNAIVPAVTAYRGPLAVMSFDPFLVARVQDALPDTPVGLVSGRFDSPTWDPHVRSWSTRFALRHMLSVPLLRPAFVNYDISAIGAFAPQWLRRRGMPLLTWTVRTPTHRADAERLADAMVFEGFVP